MDLNGNWWLAIILGLVILALSALSRGDGRCAAIEGNKTG